ncbi:hypothetical protein ACIA98_31595 [Streptomyces sp. NPDC051366]|uniref:hypothetical protein n=1 Tax=Streptomyces sp. NPDC051366 TaxID=3365652 RepID=UPI0037BB01BE
MIMLSVDTTSQSYAVGRVVGVSLAAAVAIVLVWRLTTAWRNPSPSSAAEAAALRGVRAKRRALIVAVMVLIAAAAAVKATTSYHPEPPAAQTQADSGSIGAGASPHTITLPDSFAGFRLHYDRDGDENLHALFMVNSTD